MSKNRIIKAQLTKEKTVDKIGLAETLDSKARREHAGIKCDWIAHEDLIRAFEALNPHVGFIAELPEVLGQSLEEIPFIPNIDVISFSIGGEDETEGISITAMRHLENQLTQTVNTPFMRWDHANYPYMAELSEAVYTLQQEVQLYYDGKQAPKRQLEMFGENLEGEINVEGGDDQEPAKVKKPRKKKAAAPTEAEAEF